MILRVEGASALVGKAIERDVVVKEEDFGFDASGRVGFICLCAFLDLVDIGVGYRLVILFLQIAICAFRIFDDRGFFVIRDDLIRFWIVVATTKQRD